jgi:hypothetical protein
LRVNRVVDALYSILNLLRFAHNWIVGILERWPALARQKCYRAHSLYYLGKGSLSTQVQQISLPWRDLAGTL